MVRVATQNLYGDSGDWAARRAMLVDGLRALRPDLVAFQEAIVTDAYDQVADLLGPEFHVAHQTERGANGSGSSIASRWPLADIREVDLHVTPRTADFACGALLAEVLAPEPIGPLLFVNHVPSWQLSFACERELQAVVTARAVEERIAGRDWHVVLAGDFDADPDASSVRFWSGRQALGGVSVCYRDAWERALSGELGETFTPNNSLVTDWDWPFRRIDYIFVRCGEHGGADARHYLLRAHLRHATRRRLGERPLRCRGRPRRSPRTGRGPEPGEGVAIGARYRATKVHSSSLTSVG